MSERIDHYAAAVGMLKDAQAAQDLSMVGIIAQGAQVHATLALAEQQRIANLIAAVEIEGGPYRLVNIWPDAWQKATEEIKEALGL